MDAADRWNINTAIDHVETAIWALDKIDPPRNTRQLQALNQVKDALAEADFHLTCTDWSE